MKIYLIIVALTLCVDTLAVGIACGVGKMRFCAGGWAAFLITGAAAVGLSAVFGRLLAVFEAGRVTGGILLALTGVVIILQETGFLSEIPLLNLITAPERSDADKNRIIDFREAAVLSLALSVDACIACAGSGAGGFVLALSVIILQPLFIRLGIAIGKRFEIKGGGRFCGVMSGVLLLALGVENICLS